MTCRCWVAQGFGGEPDPFTDRQANQRLIYRALAYWEEPRMSYRTGNRCGLVHTHRRSLIWCLAPKIRPRGSFRRLIGRPVADAACSVVPKIPTAGLGNPLRRWASLATIRCKCGILAGLLIRSKIALVHALCTYGRLHTFFLSDAMGWHRSVSTNAMYPLLLNVQSTVDVSVGLVYGPV